ncbi:MAG: hypothetical protein Q8P53_04480 [Candidatus Shapirobacteria bacterium]|nr:hypothetical protein [Candidatus Shapirobacteria bacterium]
MDTEINVILIKLIFKLYIILIMNPIIDTIDIETNIENPILSKMSMFLSNSAKEIENPGINILIKNNKIMIISFFIFF